MPLGTAAAFGKVDAKTYNRAPKLRRDPEGGPTSFTAPFKKCEAGFLALTHRLLVPMPAPALDTVSTTRRA